MVWIVCNVTACSRSHLDCPIKIRQFRCGWLRVVMGL